MPSAGVYHYLYEKVALKVPGEATSVVQEGCLSQDHGRQPLARGSICSATAAGGPA